MHYQPVKFSREQRDELLRALRANVRQYFDDNQLSSYGGTRMIGKSIAMISIYLIPYLLMLTGVISHPVAVFVSWIVMGIGVAGIGMSVMHDANHGSYSRNPRINRLMGNMLNLVGGLALNWRVQHNKLHHSYTNIEGHDEDIAPRAIMRFSPHDKHYAIHRYQHYYAWFFYGLMTLAWVTVKDFRQAIDYHNRGLLGKESGSLPLLLLRIAGLKIAYFAYILLLPIMLTDIPTWQIIVGFLAMQFTAGLILGSVFQLAHVMPETEFPMPNDDNVIEHQWAKHQLMTTTNFAPGHKLLNWYVGGLNHQVEHHLFPNICHIHYPKIAPIVEKTAKEYGAPYHSIPTFREALEHHADMLKALGRSTTKTAPVAQAIV